MIRRCCFVCGLNDWRQFGLPEGPMRVTWFECLYCGHFMMRSRTTPRHRVHSIPMSTIAPLCPRERDGGIDSRIVALQQRQCRNSCMSPGFGKCHPDAVDRSVKGCQLVRRGSHESLSLAATREIGGSRQALPCSGRNAPNVTNFTLAIDDTRQSRESIQQSLDEMRAMCLRRY
jgi:hypothetical protein